MNMFGAGLLWLMAIPAVARPAMTNREATSKIRFIILLLRARPLMRFQRRASLIVRGLWAGYYGSSIQYQQNAKTFA